MKKRIFSLKLYLEGLRQTKLIGIIAFIILTIQAIAIPIGEVINNITYNYTSGPSGVYFEEVNPFLYAMIYVVSPLLVLTLFSFLNKRKSSDFYHSIADTRVCLFLSYYSAILTWVVSISILTTLIGTAVNGMFPQHFTLNLYNIWYTTLNIIAASLYNAAAVTLAMTLTGTLVTNIAVAGLIMVVPDYLTFIINQMVMSNIPIAPSDAGIGDFLPIGFNFISESIEFSLTDISKTIYTIILSVAVAGIALIIFIFRKSESAGYPALNKYLQAAIRITFCMILCVFACGGIFVNVNGIEEFDATSLFAIIMIYIAALIVYFLYEIITTKKFKTAFKAIPALLIVIVLNIACVLGMTVMYRSYIAFNPAATEIDYITINQQDSYVYDISTYLETKCAKIKLEDDSTKKIVSGILSENIKKLKNDTFYDDFSTYMNVTICVNGIEHKRELVLSEKELNTILDTLKNSEEYKNTFYTLPDPSSVSIDTYDMPKMILDSEAKHLYEIMKNEIAELDFKDWYMLAYNNTYSAAVADFNVIVNDGAKTYDFYIPIYSSLNKTVNEYIRLTYDQDATDSVMKMLEKPDEYEEIIISFYNAPNISDYYYCKGDGEYNYERLNSILEKLVPCESVAPDDIFCKVYVYDEYSAKYEESADYVDFASKAYSVFFKYTGDPKDLTD